jgi:hypothetical protein
MLNTELSDIGVKRVEGVLGKQEIGKGKAGPGRGNKTGDIVTRFRRGNEASYTVARLRRDAPELADAVERGELSANAAAIRAGFRHKTWTAPADPELLAKRIATKFPGWEMRKIV